MSSEENELIKSLREIDSIPKIPYSDNSNNDSSVNSVTKRPRLSGEEEEKSVSTSAQLSSPAQVSSPAKVKSSVSVSVKAVMSDAYTKDTPLTHVIIANISDRKEAGKLAINLPPLPPALSHLKRIRTYQGALQIIVQPATESEEIIIKRTLEDPERFQGLDLDSLRRVEVSSSAPLTRRQYNAVSTFWPSNFHPDKNVEKLLSENCGFSSEELAQCEQNVRRIFETSRASGNEPVCLIYDPKDRDVVVCTTGVRKELHPIKHCSLVALDTLGKIQGGRNDKEQDTLAGSSSSKRVRNGPQDYLATGLDAYLTNEPCLMCAMALLHSRAKRVFYVNKSGNVGALESVTKLQDLPNINHRYQVFSLQLDRS